LIRQVKPPALLSVDLSNVPAASCSIIMASSPLLLRRQCLSPLGSSTRLLLSSSSSPRLHRSSYCFLFLFRPSTLVYPLRVLCLIAPSIPLFCGSSFVVRAWQANSIFLLSSSVHPDAAVTRITRIASKTANNKCFSAHRNAVKFLPTQHRFYARARGFPRDCKPSIRERIGTLFAFFSCGDSRLAVPRETARP